MKPRCLSLSMLCTLVVCLLAPLSGCSLLGHRHAGNAPAPPENKPGMVGKRANARGLTVEIKSSPDPVRLGETREIDVTLVVRNVSKNTANLKFATSQTIEILLRDPATGKVVSQWSTDRTFTADSRYVVVNPSERLEYHEPITTRELKAGKPYNLEAYFVGYDQELRATKTIIPQP